ncbi:MAG: DUF456 domain-containing protein [Acidobacteriota bacterium]|nr:DUF456 domain-containing protein [Acidobacteriota bacterium]
MTIALYVIGGILILAGLVGLVLPALPGAPLMFAGIFSVAWADGFTRIGWPGLVVMGLLAVLISVIDFAAEIVGARKFGASYWGLLGAFLGFVAGLAFLPFGIIIGPIVGAVLFEYLKEPDLKRAGKVGVGTMIGFVVGTALKYALAFVLLGLAVVFYLA